MQNTLIIILIILITLSLVLFLINLYIRYLERKKIFSIINTMYSKKDKHLSKKLQKCLEIIERNKEV